MLSNKIEKKHTECKLTQQSAHIIHQDQLLRITVSYGVRVFPIYLLLMYYSQKQHGKVDGVNLEHVKAMIPMTRFRKNKFTVEGNILGGRGAGEVIQEDAPVL